MDRLKKRSDFLRVARGHKQVRRALVLQAWQHQLTDHEPATSDRASGKPPRIGFTVTRKVGNAVVRNRVRRRLKEAVRLLETADKAHGNHSGFLPDTDYVVVGRLSALTMPFSEIQQDLASARDKIGAQISRRARQLGKKPENPKPDHSPIEQNPLKEQGIKPTDTV